MARYLNLRVGYRARIGLRADEQSGPGWARQNPAQGGEQKAVAGLPARAGGPGVREPGVGDRPVSRGAPEEGVPFKKSGRNIRRPGACTRGARDRDDRDAAPVRSPDENVIEQLSVPIRRFRNEFARARLVAATFAVAAAAPPLQSRLCWSRLEEDRTVQSPNVCLRTVAT